MPIKRFWLMSRNIDRLLAEDSMRLAQVAIASQSGEGFSELMRVQQKQIGQIVIIDEVKRAQTEELDRDGLAALKQLGKVR